MRTIILFFACWWVFGAVELGFAQKTAQKDTETTKTAPERVIPKTEEKSTDSKTRDVKAEKSDGPETRAEKNRDGKRASVEKSKSASGDIKGTSKADSKVDNADTPEYKRARKEE